MTVTITIQDKPNDGVEVTLRKHNPMQDDESTSLAMSLAMVIEQGLNKAIKERDEQASH